MNQGYESKDPHRTWYWVGVYGIKNYEAYKAIKSSVEEEAMLNPSCFLTLWREGDAEQEEQSMGSILFA